MSFKAAEENKSDNCVSTKSYFDNPSIIKGSQHMRNILYVKVAPSTSLISGFKADDGGL